MTYFIVVSYWPNRDAIRAYAGEDIEKVHDLPRDKEFLIDPERLVKHYDIKIDKHGPANEKHWNAPDPNVACAEAKDRSLCSALLAIRDRDQVVRYEGINHPDDPTIKDRIAETDRQNLVLVDAILAKYGWPTKAMASAIGANAAWGVIQHADLDTQKRYLDLMTKAADAGDLGWALLATTIDRIRVREGKPQIYGSQFHEVNGESVPYPIEDEANVDARRAKVGLQPLAEYAKALREMFAKPKK
jgi:hypothetical protein